MFGRRHKTKTVKRKGRVSRVRRGAKTHPGFKAVAASIARRQGLPLARARAILAARTRKASAKAKKINPRLKRVRVKRRGRRK